MSVILHRRVEEKKVNKVNKVGSRHLGVVSFPEWKREEVPGICVLNNLSDMFNLEKECEWGMVLENEEFVAACLQFTELK